ncbi:hypothetical protein E2C01_020957 [Portunus trituberculatus]|uniref:Uncharacterized protein n=1 Tax=Portunus trituberculatus TaxID=210409 RepID=A0A5B7E4T8_PORTR|nr:hypothetical protein [Portunus trituberculatus]
MPQPSQRTDLQSNEQLLTPAQYSPQVFSCRTPSNSLRNYSDAYNSNTFRRNKKANIIHKPSKIECERRQFRL